MNQENKFDEIKEKLLQFWAAFLDICGKFLEYVKVNGGALLENLAVWAAGVWEKLCTLFGQAADWVQTTYAGLTAGKDNPAEALPAAREPQPLPAAAPEQEKDPESAEELPEPDDLDEIPELPADETGEPDTEAAETPQQAETEVPAQTETVEAGGSWLQKAGPVLASVGGGIKVAVKWIWKLRSVFMAIPVLWAAIKFAMQNLERLPEQVGLDIQSTGEFARMITREEAVWWPFGITMFCLVLMFCSKKPVLPWVTSIFTLVLPWLIWILNYYA